MEIEKRKDIDELFREVKDFDLVLTVEPSLADSLNARIEEPMFGKLAYTPKQLGYSKNESALGKKALTIRCLNKTGLSGKTVQHHVDRLVDCWKHEGEFGKVREYSEFRSEEAKKVLEIVEESRTVFDEMEGLEVTESSVAVVGEYQFTELDMKPVPEEYSGISFYRDGEVQLPEFKVFPSYSSIISTVLRKMEEENLEDIGVVVAKNSVYAKLLKAKMESKDIPFLHQKKVYEYRGFKKLVKAFEAVLKNNLKVKDVFEMMDGSVSISDFEKNVRDVESGKEFISKLERVSEGCIKDFQELDYVIIEKEVEEFLREVGLWEKEVSEESFNELRFLARNVPSGTEKGGGGVLVADFSSVAKIDRTYVFYLGMDSSWSFEQRDLPWVDREGEGEKALENFINLVQSGEKKYFLVQDRFMNEEIVPSPFLNELAELESFVDSKHTRMFEPRKGKEQPVFELEECSCSEVGSDLFSQSSLNMFYNCPKDYFFSRIVEEHGKDYFARGTGFHDFAEIYFHHPSFVKENIEEVREALFNNVKPFLPRKKHVIERSSLEVGTEILMEVIDSLEVEETFIDSYSGDEGNFLAEEFDLEISGGHTERRFRNPELGIKGIVDMVTDRKSLIDYKSGGKKSKREVFKLSKPSMIDESDKPNFQALMYLLNHSQLFPETELSFTFLHFLEERKNYIKRGVLNIQKMETEIKYYPLRFKEFLKTRKCFEKCIGSVNKSNSRRKTLEKLGFEKFREVFENSFNPGIFMGREEAVESGLAEKMTEKAREHVGEYKYVSKGIKSAFKRLSRIRGTSFFSEDLEEFKEFVIEQLERLELYRENGFPEGDISDSTELRNKDLVLRGEGV